MSFFVSDALKGKISESSLHSLGEYEEESRPLSHYIKINDVKLQVNQIYFDTNNDHLTCILGKDSHVKSILQPGIIEYYCGTTKVRTWEGKRDIRRIS